MREIIFSETHEKSEEKMMVKNRRKKVRKNVFYIHMNIVKKWGGKRETIFPETRQ